MSTKLAGKFVVEKGVSSALRPLVLGASLRAPQ
jgi:hypothetical protein